MSGHEYRRELSAKGAEALGVTRGPEPPIVGFANRSDRISPPIAETVIRSIVTTVDDPAMLPPEARPA